MFVARDMSWFLPGLPAPFFSTAEKKTGAGKTGNEANSRPRGPTVVGCKGVLISIYTDIQVHREGDGQSITKAGSSAEDCPETVVSQVLQ